MPKSLDKLKALTDRLEKRTTQKREASHSTKYFHEAPLSSSPRSSSPDISNKSSQSLHETVDLINASQAFEFEEEYIKDQELLQKTAPLQTKQNAKEREATEYPS